MPEGSSRAASLATQVQDAAAALIAVVESVDDDAWNRVPGPGVWSIGKEVEHIFDGAAYHLWFVQFTLGQTTKSRRPTIERDRLTTAWSPSELVTLLRTRALECATIVGGLTDAQLELPTKPPRARNQSLDWTIEQVMIDHFHNHRAEVETKLRLQAGR